MKTFVGFLVVLTSLAGPSHLTAQKAVSLSQQDLAMAEYEYTNEFSLQLELEHKTLFQAPVAFLDGARGYEITPKFNIGALNVTGNSHTDPLSLHQYGYCNSSLIVVARDVAESTVLSPNQRGVFTATQFQIEKILKSDGSHRQTDTITAIHFGGTVLASNSTVLRVAVEGEKPYKQQKSYLLYLHKSLDHPSDAFFLIGYHNIKVENGRIIPTTRPSDGMIPNPARYGESLTGYWKRHTDYLQTNPCR